MGLVPEKAASYHAQHHHPDLPVFCSHVHLFIAKHTCSLEAPEAGPLMGVSPEI